MIDPDKRPVPEDSLEALLSSQQLPDGASEEDRQVFLFVKACREAAHDLTSGANLAERALSCTTREDLSWRGDLRVTRSFITDRLRSSALLRLAAASLLLHIAALPVVAVYMMIEKEPPLEFSVDVADGANPFAEDSPQEVPQELEISELPGFDALLSGNTLNWSRWHLEESRLRARGAPVQVPAWLVERHALLTGNASPEVVDANSPIPPEFLRLEVLLDRHVVGPRGAKFTSEDFDALKRATELCRRAEGLTAWMGAAALARAESYGLSDSSSQAFLEEARSSLAGHDRLRPLLEVSGDVRALMPMDPLWLEAALQVDVDCVPSAYIRYMRNVGPVELR